MTPTHTFNVDLTNPGQFLACCGLLELANCLGPEAMGWFGDGVFHLHAASNDSQTLVDQFLDCSAEASPAGSIVTDEDDEEGEKSPPLNLGVPFALRLERIHFCLSVASVCEEAVTVVCCNARDRVGNSIG